MQIFFPSTMARSFPPMPWALLALAMIASTVKSTNAFAIEIAFNETECFSKEIENARDADNSHELPFRVLGAYVVSKDPHKYYEMQRGERNLAIVQVEVKQPDGTVIHRDREGKSRSEFDVNGVGVGSYAICFTNSGTKGKKSWLQALPHQKKPQEAPAYVRVHYFQPVHDDDTDEIDEYLAKSPKNTKGGDANVPRKADASGGKKAKDTSKVLSAGHASDINVLALNLQDEVSLMRQELFYLKARASRHKKTADSNARRTLWWTVAEVCTLCIVAAVQVYAVTYFFNKDEKGKVTGSRGGGVGTMYGGGGSGSFGGGGGGGFGGSSFGQGSYSQPGFGSGGSGSYGNQGGQPYGQGMQPGGGVLPPQAVPGQGTGSYSYGGQAQGIGGGSVYGDQSGLRGRGGGTEMGY